MRNDFNGIIMFNYISIHICGKLCSLTELFEFAYALVSFKKRCNSDEEIPGLYYKNRKICVCREANPGAKRPCMSKEDLGMCLYIII